MLMLFVVRPCLTLTSQYLLTAFPLISQYLVTAFPLTFHCLLTAFPSPSHRLLTAVSLPLGRPSRGGAPGHAERWLSVPLRAVVSRCHCCMFVSIENEERVSTM